MVPMSDFGNPLQIRVVMDTLLSAFCQLHNDLKTVHVPTMRILEGYKHIPLARKNLTDSLNLAIRQQLQQFQFFLIPAAFYLYSFGKKINKQQKKTFIQIRKKFQKQTLKNMLIDANKFVGYQACKHLNSTSCLKKLNI